MVRTLSFDWDRRCERRRSRAGGRALERAQKYHGPEKNGAVMRIRRLESQDHLRRELGLEPVPLRTVPPDTHGERPTLHRFPSQPFRCRASVRPEFHRAGRPGCGKELDPARGRRARAGDGDVRDLAPRGRRRAHARHARVPGRSRREPAGAPGARRGRGRGRRGVARPPRRDDGALPASVRDGRRAARRRSSDPLRALGSEARPRRGDRPERRRRGRVGERRGREEHGVPARVRRGRTLHDPRPRARGASGRARCRAGRPRP